MSLHATTCHNTLRARLTLGRCKAPSVLPKANLRFDGEGQARPALPGKTDEYGGGTPVEIWLKLV